MLGVSMQVFRLGRLVSVTGYLFWLGSKNFLRLYSCGL